MLRQLMFVMSVAFFAIAASANAVEFEATFEGLASGMVTLSGKTYPLKPDVMAHYEGRFIAVDVLPEGTPVKFELGEFVGVSSVVQLEVTEASETLDEMFPPH